MKLHLNLDPILTKLLLKDVDPSVGGGVDRDKLPDSDFAGKNRSYPIATEADVADALSSIGRADADNYSHDELHSRILAIARRKGFQVPESVESTEPGGMMPRTRARVDPNGPRRVDSDHGGRVPLPADISRTKHPAIAGSESELFDPYGFDVDISTPKLDMTAAAVQYQNVSNEPARACYLCRFYDPDGDGDAECALVAGNIRPLGTCNLHEVPFGKTADSEAVPVQADDEDDAEMSDSAVLECALSEFVWGGEFQEGSPIQIMRTGSFKHPQYGDFTITPDDLQEIVKNFADNVRGQQIPIDVNHDHRAAVGWMSSLSVVDGDKLFATPDWTDDGARSVKNGEYRYFSPHFGPWEDPESGKKYRLVLMSGAVTNLPFLKNMEPLSLSELESRRLEQKGAHVELTEAQIADLQRELSEAKAARDQQSTMLAEMQTSQKSLSEMIETQKTQIDAQTVLIEKQRHDGMVRELTEVVRGSGDVNHRWIGNEEQQVTFLVKLAESFGRDSEEVKHYIDENTANAERMRAGGLFTERGASGAQINENSATAQFERLLTEKMAAGTPRSDAIMAIANSQPDLYRRYDQETVRTSSHRQEV